MYSLSNQQDFFHPIPYGYRAVLKVLQYRHKMSKESHCGIVRLLEGVAASHILKAEKAVLVEHPTSFPLPGGLMIQSCLVDYPDHPQEFLPILVKNE